MSVRLAFSSFLKRFRCIISFRSTSGGLELPPPPPKNALATALALRGWSIPQHVAPDGSWNDNTFGSSEQPSCLDFWLLSPAVPDIWTQEVRPLPGHLHAMVSIEIPNIARRPPDVAPCPPISWNFQNAVQTCSPVDWPSVTQEIATLLDKDRLDLAWHLWDFWAFQEIASHSVAPPSRPSGDTWHMTRSYNARLYQTGEAGPRLTMLFRSARRLLDYGKWGGQKVLSRLVRDLPILVRQFDLHSTSEQLLARPIEASKILYDKARHLQDLDRKGALRKWEQSLQQQGKTW